MVKIGKIGLVNYLLLEKDVKGIGTKKPFDSFISQMVNILFIVGLPGSGKTTLAKNINENKGGSYRIIDDPKDFDLDVLPFLNENLIITDPHLCNGNIREMAVSKILAQTEANIEWIFFENNPKVCLENIIARDGGKVKPSIINFTRIYKVPDGVEALSVFNSKNKS